MCPSGYQSPSQVRGLPVLQYDGSGYCLQYGKSARRV
jgi:hypothetical protein